MEQNTTVRKKLFKILKKFAKNSQTKEDMQALCEIIYYETPYKNRIVQPTTKENLFVYVAPNIQNYNEETKKMEETPNVAGEHTKRNVIINMSTYKDLGELFNVLGHENTHERQDDVQTSGYDNISEGAKEIIDSKSYGMFQNNITDFYNALGISPNKPIETLFSEQYKVNENISRKTIDYYSYAQLPYEENARNCGFEFAHEMLEAIKNDELCDGKLRKYIEECEDSLDKAWKKETNRRNSPLYKNMRAIYNSAIKQCGSIDVKKIATMQESLVKQQIIDGKLYNMRKENVDKATYYKALIAFRRDSAMSLKDASYYYLVDADVKELTIESLLDGDNGARALGNINFILPKDHVVLSPEEISNLCQKWAEQGKFKNIYDILINLDTEYTGFVADPFLPKDRIEKIKKSISENYLIYQTTHEYFEKLASLSHKKIEDMTDLELQAFSALRETLVYIEKQLGVSTEKIENQMKDIDAVNVFELNLEIGKRKEKKISDEKENAVNSQNVTIENVEEQKATLAENEQTAKQPIQSNEVEEENV